jgi:hypothetical protein
MSLWVWIVVVSGTVLALSLLVGLALAAILGSITRELSELVELEPWADAPLADERLAGIELESTPSASSRRGRAHA